MMEAVSLRLLSKNFPKLFISFSEMVGIGVPVMEKRKTKDLDFVGLNTILAHPTTLSNPFKTHLPPGTDSVVTVRSSMKV